MVYAALLRGINVGGKNILPMKDLKSCLEKAGMCDVQTYIASGNVVFRTEECAISEIREKLEKAILLEFNLEIKVLVLDQSNFNRIADSIPPEWSNDEEQKSDVMFLWQSDDSPAILKAIPWNPDIESVIYTPGAVLWNVPRTLQSKSRMVSLIGTPLYRNLTIRNVNTVRKLVQMMVKMSD